MFIIKQKTLVSLVIALGILISGVAYATVIGGKHDMSNTGSASIRSSAGVLGNQVCVYCHTPHNAGKNTLLWNKATGAATTFKLYSSASLSPAAGAATLSVDSPSLLCLACHDGKTAVNVLHNGGTGALVSTVTNPVGFINTGYPAGAVLIEGTAAKVLPSEILGDPAGPGIGGPTGDDLTNDHPIGFDYALSAGQKGAANLHLSPGAEFRFFNGKMECSTCHNPHADNAGTPAIPYMLVKNNAGSALCLSCHNK